MKDIGIVLMLILLSCSIIYLNEQLKSTQQKLEDTRNIVARYMVQKNTGPILYP